MSLAFNTLSRWLSRRRCWVTSWRAVGAVFVLALIGVILIWPRIASHDAAGSRDGTGPLDRRSVALGRPAPDFALRDPAGHIVRLSELRGHIVLVNFWATWCQPCKEELPAIAQAYRERHDSGLRVLEVDEQESPNDVIAYAGQINDMPPILLDGNGSVFLTQYPRTGLPDSFFIDRQGIVQAASVGPMTYETILKDIEVAGR